MKEITILSLQVNLALYCHHREQTTVALRLMYRVRYLILLMFGQDTPEIATCDVSVTDDCVNAIILFKTLLWLSRILISKLNCLKYKLNLSMLKIAVANH